MASFDATGDEVTSEKRRLDSAHEASIDGFGALRGVRRGVVHKVHPCPTARRASAVARCSEETTKPVTAATRRS